ncbi:MAG: alpha/beta fold hydrolase [Deltaproteobacteria bacterium]|jgi:3-oxoadipate enol-lactonase|nr:alpha/beta fold hydrolase [Deltaproteobacteria bacterium]
MLKRTPAKDYIRTCCTIRDADLRKAAASISRPTLVVGGDQDMATPPELAEKPADALTGVKFSLFEDAAHISCVEQPAIFSSLVINFLEGISNA